MLSYNGRQQKSPPGLRRAGFQDFVDWLWYPSTKNFGGLAGVEPVSEILQLTE
jgi:hypothetical protein